MKFKHQFAGKLMMLALAAILVGCGGNSARPTPSTQPSSSSPETTTPSDRDQIGTPQPLITPASADTSSSVTPSSSSAVEPFPIPTRGASRALDDDDDNALTWEQYSQALRNLFVVYPWPENSLVTPDVMLGNWPEEDHASLFEPGFELNTLHIYWMCAWSSTWLDARNGVDPGLEAQALEYIVNSFPLTSDDERSQAFLSTIGARALIGDPNGVIEFYEANNCSALIP